jgi:hypothetical protein
MANWAFGSLQHCRIGQKAVKAAQGLLRLGQVSAKAGEKFPTVSFLL